MSLLAGVCAGAQAPDEPSLSQLVEAQQAALGSGDADQVFRSSRDLGALALRLLAASELRGGDAVAASEHDRQSIEIRETTGARLELAAALVASKKFPAAVKEIDAVISTEPKSAAAWSLRGQALLLEENRPGAIEALERAEAISPDVTTELILLEARLQMKQTAEVRALMERMVKRQGDSAPLRLLLASSLERAGDLDGAIGQAREAVALAPDSPGAHLALGSAFWELNEYQYNEVSLEQFTIAQRLDPGGYLSNYNLGAVESQYELFEPAAKHLRAAAAADPSAPDPDFQLGMNAYAQSDAKSARRYLERYVATVKKGPARNDSQLRRALLVLNRVAVEEGRDGDAGALQAEADQIKERLVREAVPMTSNQSFGMVATNPPVNSARQPASAPGDRTASQTSANAVGRDRELKEIVAKSLNDMGTVLARKHDYAGATVPFRYAAEADAKLDPVMRNLGLAAFHTGAYDESQKALAVWVAEHPEDALARADMAMSLLQLDRFREAADAFHAGEPAISVSPLFGPAYALAVVRSGSSAESGGILGRVLAASHEPETLVSVAAVFVELPDLTQAAALARSALGVNAGVRGAHLALGRALLAEGKPAAAADEFRAEIASAADAAQTKEARLLLARALAAAGKRPEAAAIAGDLKKSDPGYAGELRKRGQALLKAGATRAALEELEGAAMLDPQAVGLREEIAGAQRLLAGRGR